MRENDPLHPSHQVGIEIHDETAPAAATLCAAEGMRKALAAAGTSVLQPVMALEVSIDEEHVGAVLNDLRSCRNKRFQLFCPPPPPLTDVCSLYLLPQLHALWDRPGRRGDGRRQRGCGRGWWGDEDTLALFACFAQCIHPVSTPSAGAAGHHGRLRVGAAVLDIWQVRLWARSPCGAFVDVVDVSLHPWTFLHRGTFTMHYSRHEELSGAELAALRTSLDI